MEAVVPVGVEYESLGFQRYRAQTGEEKAGIDASSLERGLNRKAIIWYSYGSEGKVLTQPAVEYFLPSRLAGVAQLVRAAVS
jgi:hypothetical protein